ncbi:MAG: hypothetical protein CXZ00_16525 [Acidobacteria bacterium]|nr:MAG: hypothetical protein CXZ00_16525 [Acidobacteriota bacterium]
MALRSLCSGDAQNFNPKPVVANSTSGTIFRHAAANFQMASIRLFQIQFTEGATAVAVPEL